MLHYKIENFVLVLLVVAVYAVPQHNLFQTTSPFRKLIGLRSMHFGGFPQYNENDDGKINEEPIFVFPQDAFDYIPVFNTGNLPESGNNAISGETTDPEPENVTPEDKSLSCDFNPLEELEQKDSNIDRSPSRRVSEIQCEYNMWSYKYMVLEQERRQTVCPGSSGVYGGKNVTQGEFPHMGAMGWKKIVRNDEDPVYHFMCGSSLISLRFALSAAHCRKVDVKSMKELGLESEQAIVIRFGSVYIASKKDRVEHFEDKFIEKFITPANYNFKYHYNDIMLIHLKKDVDISHNIRPACLHTGELTGLTNLNVTGWGATETVKNSDVLLYAEVKEMDHKKCGDQYDMRKSRKVWVGLQDHQFCAGVEGGVYDTCEGDSGGPVQIQQRLPTTIDKAGIMYYIVGITSFGYGCGKLPGVYIKVSDHNILCWIERNVWPEQINPLCRGNVFEGYTYTFQN